jgi:hypothetical protein
VRREQALVAAADYGDNGGGEVANIVLEGKRQKKAGCQTIGTILLFPCGEEGVGEEEEEKQRVPYGPNEML